MYKELDRSIFSSLKGLCEGHPGLTRASLCRIQNDFKIGEDHLTIENFTDKVLLYISDGTLSEKLLDDSRCFISPQKIAGYLKVDVSIILQLVEMMLIGSTKYSGII